MFSDARSARSRRAQHCTFSPRNEERSSEQRWIKICSNQSPIAQTRPQSGWWWSDWALVKAAHVTMFRMMRGASPECRDIYMVISTGSATLAGSHHYQLLIIVIKGSQHTSHATFCIAPTRAQSSRHSAGAFNWALVRETFCITRGRIAHPVSPNQDRGSRLSGWDPFGSHVLMGSHRPLSRVADWECMN